MRRHSSRRAPLAFFNLRGAEIFKVNRQRWTLYTPISFSAKVFEFLGEINESFKLGKHWCKEERTATAFVCACGREREWGTGRRGWDGTFLLEQEFHCWNLKYMGIYISLNSSITGNHQWKFPTMSSNMMMLNKEEMKTKHAVITFTWPVRMTETGEGEGEGEQQDQMLRGLILTTHDCFISLLFVLFGSVDGIHD